MRVPKAWGEDGGPRMVKAAFLELPYPEAGVVDEETLTEQSTRSRQLASRAAARRRRLLLCARRRRRGARHAIGRLGSRLVRRARRPQHPGIVAERKPLGMPLRMLIDSGHGGRGGRGSGGGPQPRPAGEETFIADERPAPRREEGIAQALDGVDAVYVAFDCDVLEPDCGVLDVHARAGRDDSRGGRGRPRRAGNGTRPSPALSEVWPRIPRTSPGSPASVGAVGL